MCVGTRTAPTSVLLVRARWANTEEVAAGFVVKRARARLWCVEGVLVGVLEGVDQKR